MKPAAVIVLAAGEGTRMKSSTPKVMHTLGGRSLVGHALAAARGTDPEQVVVVVGSGRELVTAHLARDRPEAVPVVQEPRNGTGHAVRIALGRSGRPTSPAPCSWSAATSRCCARRPCRQLLDRHHGEGNAATVLTAILPDPTGYGRIVRDASGAVTAIVEHRDATDEQRAIAEINSGIYAFDGGAAARGARAGCSTDNSQGEEYLTDALAILRGDGHRGRRAAAPTTTTRSTASTTASSSPTLRRLLNDRVLEQLDARRRHRRSTRPPPGSTSASTLGADVTLAPEHPAARPARRSPTGAVVGPNSTLTDTEVGESATVLRHRTRTGAEIGPGVVGRPVLLPAPGHEAGGQVQGRRLRRDEELQHRRGLEGPAPVLRRRRRRSASGSNIGAATIFVNYDGVDQAAAPRSGTTSGSAATPCWSPR